jgi:hypothetical protein
VVSVVALHAKTGGVMAADRFCVACGAVITAGDQFCGTCGARQPIGDPPLPGSEGPAEHPASQAPTASAPREGASPSASAAEHVPTPSRLGRRSAIVLAAAVGIVLAVGAVALLLGGGKGNGQTKVAMTVGPGGGSAHLASMTVRVPPGALAGPAKLTLTKSPAPGRDTAVDVVGPMIKIGLNKKLRAPAEITTTLSRGENGGGTFLVHWNTATKRWEPALTRLDPGGRSITAATRAFSIWGKGQNSLDALKKQAIKNANKAAKLINDTAGAIGDFGAKVLGFRSDPPSCNGEARRTLDNGGQPPDAPPLWGCAENSSNDEVRVRVVNNRSVTVRVKSSWDTGINTAPSMPLESDGGSLPGEVARNAINAQRQKHPEAPLFLPPGATASVLVPNRPTYGVKIESTPDADAILFGGLLQLTGEVAKADAIVNETDCAYEAAGGASAQPKLNTEALTACALNQIGGLGGKIVKAVQIAVPIAETAAGNAKPAYMAGRITIGPRIVGQLPSTSSKLSNLTLTAEGLGPIHMGMTVDEAMKASGGALRQTATSTPGCSLLEPTDGSPLIRISVYNDEVLGFDTESSAYQTSKGVRVSDPITRFTEAHNGAIQVPQQPRLYIVQQGDTVLEAVSNEGGSITSLIVERRLTVGRDICA